MSLPGNLIKYNERVIKYDLLTPRVSPVCTVSVTFIQSPPACDPGCLSHQIRIIFRYTDRDYVGLKRYGLVEPKKKSVKCLPDSQNGFFLTSEGRDHTRMSWGQIWGGWQQSEPSCLGMSTAPETRH